jgi:hypothetical protein
VLYGGDESRPTVSVSYIRRVYTSVAPELDDDVKTEEFGDYKMYPNSAQIDQGTGNNRSDSSL